VSKPDGSIPALVYAEPTILPGVNRLVLAAANSGGFWQSPSYALGNKKGEAWLIVDKCVDVAQVATENGKQRLIPNAELFTAIHWCWFCGCLYRREQFGLESVVSMLAVGSIRHSQNLFAWWDLCALY
jgi:hypothetical protein